LELNELPEETIEILIRGWLEALEKKDMEKALSFIAEDAVWIANEGTFKGKQEWRQYLTWMENHEFAVEEFEDTGIGIIVKENRAVSQYILKGKIPNGMKFEVPGVCLFEFKNGKIQQHTTIFDRLLLAKQVAKGIAEKELVGILVKRAEKGLH
jgi:ketosteroid isomerase-like protein